jgi:hypothetical protein
LRVQISLFFAGEYERGQAENCEAEDVEIHG